MLSVLSANGLLEIPEVFCLTDALKAGQQCEIERIGEREYRFRVCGFPAEPHQTESLLDVLLDCPVKDWWVEPESPERTPSAPSTLFAE